MSDALKPHLAKVARGESLDQNEAANAFSVLMAGEATDAQIGGLLMGMRVRGETVDEMTGAVSVMRETMRRVRAPENAIDIVGTGGDGAGTLNVSTCAAFVLVGCGLPVAKHGNRALSSRSGAADVLGSLGIDPEIAPDNHERMLAEAGLCFMFAPAHHAAMRFVGPARRELGTRTLFNLLGPMSNPAGVKRLVIGAFSPDWLVPMAETLNRLGAEAAWVVHGDGLDELTVSGTSQVAALTDGRIECFTIEPEDMGLSRWPLDAVKGGEGPDNAVALRAVLDGTRNAYRDIVCLNAGAGLVVAGKAADLRDGVAQAASALDEGKARAALDRVAALSQRLGRLAS